MSIYEEQGYANRRDYLRCLADEYGADVQAVFAVASVLGPDEDFDGLVVAVQDGDCGETA